MRKALARVVTAWDALPSGYHTPAIVQQWLIDDMKPAIDQARQALAARQKRTRKAPRKRP